MRQCKAEAKACLNAGQRLARQRDALWARSSGAFQPALTQWQTWLLEQYDTGARRQKLNNAIAEYGHGRLRSEAGDHLDIGGSTGGGSRRLIDGWVMPNWRDFLSQSDTIGQFLRSVSLERF